MSNLHPVFESICRSFQAAPVSALAARREAYVRQLQWHDWSFEFSDDYTVYRQGQRERDELVALRSELDADGELWNSVAPQDYRFSRSPVTPAEVSAGVAALAGASSGTEIVTALAGMRPAVAQALRAAGVAKSAAIGGAV